MKETLHARPPRRNPGRSPQTVQPVPRRILAQARPGTRLSNRFRACPDRGRLPWRPDPRGIRRRRPAAFRRRRDPGDGPGGRLQRCSVPRPDVHHGHDPAARHGQAEEDLPAENRHRRTAASGVRRHRTDQRDRYDVTAHLRPQGGRPLRRQRPEGLDQPGRALRPDAAAGADHAQGPDRQAHRGPVDLHRRHAARPSATG